MNNKIGIMTFHASNNCGSMLQAYALQNVLENKYHKKVEIIDFSSCEQKRMYSIFYKPRKVKDVFRNILNGIFYKKIYNHNCDYKTFINEYLNVSLKSFSTLEELKSEKFSYDLIITGSDQVWNIKAKDFDDAYYLPFSQETKRISYAVSLGATNPNLLSNKDKYAKYINELDGVSVRENNAKIWIKELASREIDLCVDPTLLLKPCEWDGLIGEREVKGKYIFWYTMVYKKEIADIIVELGKKYNMPIYVMDPKEWSRRSLYLKGIKLAKNGGPSSYLSLVKNAEIVITSSFHGTVFCNTFKKNFWYINIHDSDSSDDRASYLLSQLGLLDRYIKKDELLEKDLNVFPNFELQNIHKESVKKSFNYLEKYLD